MHSMETPNLEDVPLTTLNQTSKHAVLKKQHRVWGAGGAIEVFLRCPVQANKHIRDSLEAEGQDVCGSQKFFSLLNDNTT